MNTIKFNQAYREARALMLFVSVIDIAFASDVVNELMPYADTGAKLYKLLTIAPLGSKERRKVQEKLKCKTVRVV